MRAVQIIENINLKVWPVTIFTGLFFMVLTVYLHFDNVKDYKFAEEIGNVAASVAQGDGFANVFDANSGPTAWCPPLYVAYYAIIFMIFGVKSIYAAWVIYLSRCLFLALSYHFLSKIDYQYTFNRYKILLLPIFLVYAVIVIVTKKPDDVFLHVFLSSALIYSLSRFIRNGIEGQEMVIFPLSILVPFSNISLFIGMLVTVVGVLIVKSDSSFKFSLFRNHAMTIILLLLVGSVFWGIRNSFALKQFIPFKSNLWFELYLANVKDSDGLSKWSNFRKYHPLGNEEVKNHYKSVGEIAFLAKYKELSFKYLKDNPMDFTNKVINRLKDAYLFTSSQKDTEIASIHTFFPDDVKKLQEHDLIAADYWVCLEMSETEAFEKIDNLKLNNFQTVKTDWKQKALIVKERINRRDSLKEFMKSLLVSIIPLITILFGFIIKPIRNNKVFMLTAVLYSISVAPYIVVSFLPRYQFFQVTFFVVFMFFTLSYIIDLYQTKNRNTGN